MIIRAYKVMNTENDIRLTVGKEDAVSRFEDAYEFDRTDLLSVIEVVQDVDAKWRGTKIDGFVGGANYDNLLELIESVV